MPSVDDVTFIFLIRGQRWGACRHPGLFLRLALPLSTNSKTEQYCPGLWDVVCSQKMQWCS